MLALDTIFKRKGETMKPIVTETRTAIINAAHDAQIVVRPIHDLGEHDVLV